MARGFGMTALRAALGGVGGYYEGVSAEREAKRLEEQQRQALERQRELDRIGMLDKGYMTPEEAGAERGAGGAALSRALASASGMLAGRGAPAFGQGIGAGDGTAIVRGMGQVGPQQRATLGGQTFVRAEPESARMRAQELAAGRERMGEERKQAQARTEKQQAFNEQVDALVATGRIKRPDAEAAVRAGAKYGDLFMSPTERDASARGWRALQQAAERQAATASGDGGTRSEVANGLQAMGVARASSALNLLESNNRRMEQFESDVLAGKAQVTALQMEAARIAMSGQPGAALAESQLAKGVPFIMPANAKLLQYVRSAKGIAGAVREITPRGGSNLMMQMETALSGIGPGGVDAESIEQVREFRRDQLLGVREGVMALRGQRTGQQTEQAPTKEGTARTVTQAKPVNPYR